MDGVRRLDAGFIDGLIEKGQGEVEGLILES